MAVIDPYTTRRYFAQGDVAVNEPVVATPEQLEAEVSSSRSLMYLGYKFPKYNPDDLVGKKGLEVYQQMKTDDQVKACLLVKKFARLCTTWSVEPGDPDDDKSVEMAEFVTAVLKGLPGTFERTLLEIMSALEYGFSISEKVFQVIEKGQYKGKIGLKKIANREPFGYDFLLDPHGNVLGLIFVGAPLPYTGGQGAPTNSGATGIQGLGTITNPYPVDKFVIYSYNSEHGNPYGMSDLRAGYRAWLCKDWNIKWWNIFNERFGMPTVMSTYPKGKTINKETLTQIDDILKNIQAKSGFRIPEGVKFELLEATRNGGDRNCYEAAIDKYDLMLSRSILCPSLLGFQETKSGSYALGKKHFDVFLFVLEMLGRDLEQTVVGDQIIRPLIEMNYGEVEDEMMPCFQFESLEDDNTEARAGVMKILTDAGLVDSREEWIRDFVEIPKRDLVKYPYKVPVGEPEGMMPAMVQPSGDEAPGDGTPFKPGVPPQVPPPNDDEEDSDSDNKHLSKKEVQGGVDIPKSFRRETTFENKVNFSKLQTQLDQLDSALTAELQEVVKWWQDDLLKKGQKILDTQDSAAVKTLQLRYVGDFKNRLRDYMGKIHLDSKLQSLEECQKGGVPVEITRKFSLLFASKASEPWEPLPPTEAVDFFNRKVVAKIVDKNGKKTLLTLGKRVELDFYDKRAFAVAGAEQDYIVKQAQQILLNGLKSGDSNKAMSDLKQVFSKYLETGAIKDGKLTTPSRIETIVRTNVSEALNEGRKAMFADPNVADFIPYIMWSAILDDRTSDYCAAMDGLIFVRGDVQPPPAHYNCRSVIVPITSDEVKQEEGVDVASWLKENAAAGRAVGFELDCCGGKVTPKKMGKGHSKKVGPIMSGDTETH